MTLEPGSLPSIQMLDTAAPVPEKTPWGHSGMGEIVYLRTYARDLIDEGRRERWPETVERVIRGTRQINARLTAEEEELLRGHMLGLRGTVSGRALWQLGTPLVESVGMDSLVNCWFTSVTKPADFSWIMSRLMVGGGVGFSVERANVYKFPKVKHTPITHRRADDTDLIVPDTRQGWGDLIERVIESHFSGKAFSYSTLLIRSAGTPLKTFGGTASGPAPLVEGVEEICRLMCARAGKSLRSTDILDIVNIIGSIVVAGSARRSAQIAIGDPDDALFIRAKRWANGTVPPWRANSNNTLVVDHYEEIDDEPSFWRNFDGGSEPYGLFNRRLARSMGRLGERRGDPTVEGTNPCFSSDTRILTDAGWRTFEEIHGTDPMIVQDLRAIGRLDADGREVFTVDPSNNGTTTNLASRVRITARSRQLYRLTTTDGKVVRATDDHHFATPQGMVKLKDLEVGDDLLVALPDPYVADRESTDWRLGYLVGLVASDGHMHAPTGTAKVAIWDTAGILDAETARIEQIAAATIDDVVARTPALAVSHGSRPVNLQPGFTVGAPTVGGIQKRVLSSRILGSLMAERGWSKRDIGWIHAESKDLKAGFVSGLMYGDGSVQDSNGSLSWRLAQSNRPFLSHIQLVMQELGIRTSLLARRPAGAKLLPDGRGGVASYATKTMFEIVISGRRQCDRAGVVLEVPPHHVGRWSDLMGRYSKAAYRDPDLTRVASIELDAIEDVWCLSEDERRTLVAEGLTARRCAEAMLADRESCNLATIWLPNVRSLEEFKEISRLLYKVQKATALLPHPDPTTQAIVRKNLRLGQNVTGILEATDEQRSWLSPGYEALREFDREWSHEIGVPESVRLTVVQPGGTLSLLAGVTSGIHGAYAKHYVRRVRFGASDPLVEICRQRGYPVLPEVGIDGRPDHTRWVVEFPCEAREGAYLASEMSAVDQLDWLTFAQRAWADQAVSITVTYRDEEMPAIRKWLSEHYDTDVKSVSFLRYSDHGFALAPYEPITEEEFDRRVAKVHADTLATLTGVSTLDDDDCVGGACPVR